MGCLVLDMSRRFMMMASLVRGAILACSMVVIPWHGMNWHDGYTLVGLIYFFFYYASQICHIDSRESKVMDINDCNTQRYRFDHSLARTSSGETSHRPSYTKNTYTLTKKILFNQHKVVSSSMYVSTNPSHPPTLSNLQLYFRTSSCSNAPPLSTTSSQPPSLISIHPSIHPSNQPPRASPLSSSLHLAPSDLFLHLCFLFPSLSQSLLHTSKGEWGVKNREEKGSRGI